jgi:hypothetical protein
LLHGASRELLKVNCPYRFNVQLKGEDVLVRIRKDVLERGHTHSTDTSARFLERWVKDLVRSEYARDSKVGVEHLVREINLLGEEVMCLANGFHSFEEALDAIENGQLVPNRSAFVDSKAVRSLLTAVKGEKDVHTLADGPAIAGWVDDHSGSVFYYNPGVGGELETVRVCGPVVQPLLWRSCLLFSPRPIVFSGRMASRSASLRLGARDLRLITATRRRCLWTAQRVRCASTFILSLALSIMYDAKPRGRHGKRQVYVDSRVL